MNPLKLINLLGTHPPTPKSPFESLLRVTVLSKRHFARAQGSMTSTIFIKTDRAEGHSHSEVSYDQNMTVSIVSTALDKLFMCVGMSEGVLV